jgi:hypothetical protein
MEESNIKEYVINNSLLDPINSDQEPFFIVDGFLRTAKHAITNIAVARAAHEALGLSVGYLCMEDSSHYCDEMYRQCGFRPIEVSSLNYSFLSLYFRLKHKVWRRWLALRGLDAHSVLALSDEDIPLGDLIYNSLIRNNKDVYTLRHSDINTILYYIHDAYRLTRIMKLVFEELAVYAYMPSHTTYINYTVPARVAISGGSRVLCKRDGHFRWASSTKDLMRSDTWLPQHKFNSLIKQVGPDVLENYTDDRFAGRAPGAEVKLAFGNKSSPGPVVHCLNIDEKRPVGLIAPHVFSDEPHSDRDMLSIDYYQWLKYILKETTNHTSVQWLVKPHPAGRALYDEHGVVERLVASFDHISLVPGGIDTDDLLSLVDAVITVRGTIGLEALLFDCQVILCGNADYENIESVQLCLTKKEVRSALQRVAKKQPLPEREKLHARAMLFYRQGSYVYETPGLGSERQPGLSKDEIRDHDMGLIERFYSMARNGDWNSIPYYKGCLDFFSSQGKRIFFNPRLDDDYIIFDF